MSSRNEPGKAVFFSHAFEIHVRVTRISAQKQKRKTRKRERWKFTEYGCYSCKYRAVISTNRLRCFSPPFLSFFFVRIPLSSLSIPNFFLSFLSFFFVRIPLRSLSIPNFFLFSALICSISK